MTTENPSSESLFEQIQHELAAEHEQAKRSLKEVNLMLDQSQTELVKLVQRNSAITAHLQQIMGQFDTIPREDIRNVYTQALDAQQRLLVMRGQVEKLQNDQAAYQKLIHLLDRVNELNQSERITRMGKKSAGTASLEMVIKAQESERKRLSTKMHDGPAQALSNFIVQTEIAARLFDMDSTRAKEELTNLKNSAMSTFREVRTFIFDLRPMMLDDLGLFPTIKRYADNYKEQTGADLTLNVQGSERRLEPYLEVMIFRALQEMIGNAYMHNQDAPVKAQIQVHLVLDDANVKVTVMDNGRGFEPGSEEMESGMGLGLIRERVEILGGIMEVDTAPGRGCRVSFTVPALEASPS